MADQTVTDIRTDTVREVLRTRRSIGARLFDPEATVDHDVMRDAIESARWAPNHKRTEPWMFYILDRPRIHELARLNAGVFERRGSKSEVVAAKLSEWSGASGVLLLTCTSAEDAGEIQQLEDYAACAAAAQNLMLHLWAAGIGSKWSTSAVWEHEDFWSLLGHQSVPENTRVVGTFFYGVPLSLPAASRKRSHADVTVDFRRQD